MSLELDKLFMRLIDNDRAALKIIYDRTSPVTYGLLSLILEKTEDRDAALRETYVDVWQRRKERAGISGGHDLWIYEIARSTALNSGGARQTEISGHNFAHFKQLAGLDNIPSLANLEQNERMLLLSAYLSSASAEHLADKFDIEPHEVSEKLTAIVRKMRGLET